MPRNVKHGVTAPATHGRSSRVFAIISALKLTGPAQIARVVQLAVALSLPLFACLKLTDPVKAAVIEQSGSHSCTISITGPIEEGDKAKLQQLLTPTSAHKICLNSPGGSYREALKIAKLFLDDAAQVDVATVVEARASCFSACAIVFLSGVTWSEGFAGTNRTLDALGTLAFHAPYLPKGIASGAGSEDLFRAGIVAIKDLIKLEPGGPHGEFFPKDLLVEMLDRGSNDFFYVNTVEKAIKYHISVSGVSAPNNFNSVSTAMLCHVCENHFRGTGAQGRCQPSSLESKDSDFGGRQFSLLSFGAETGGQRCVISGNFVGGAFGQRGEIYWNVGGIENINSSAITPIYFYAPETLLSDLARASTGAKAMQTLTRQPQAVVPGAPETAGPRLWNHNGSTMKLVADGARRRFFYENPRQGIRAEGVTPGALLFDGARSGDNYSGTAYVFSGRCGRKYAYHVSGSVTPNERSVTMHGQAPRLDAACKVYGYRNDELVFELLGE